MSDIWSATKKKWVYLNQCNINLENDVSPITAKLGVNFFMFDHQIIKPEGLRHDTGHKDVDENIKMLYNVNINL